jgi:hypothetical protein
MARGDELLKKAGWAWPGPGRDPIALSIRPHSVIPGLIRIPTTPINPAQAGRVRKDATVCHPRDL